VCVCVCVHSECICLISCGVECNKKINTNPSVVQDVRQTRHPVVIKNTFNVRPIEVSKKEDVRILNIPHCLGAGVTGREGHRCMASQLSIYRLV